MLVETLNTNSIRNINSEIKPTIKYSNIFVGECIVKNLQLKKKKIKKKSIFYWIIYLYFSNNCTYKIK